MKNDKEFYINPDDLKNEIIISQKNKQCSNKLAEMLMTLHKKVLNFPSFKNYTKEDKEDMMFFSIERFLKKGIFTANPDKNLFAYMTTGIYINYQNYLKKMYKRLNIEREYQEQFLKSLGVNSKLYDNMIQKLENW